MEEKKYKDKSWLKTQYLDLDKTQKEMAEICSVSHGTICKWIQKFKLDFKKPGKYKRTEEINKKSRISMTGKRYSEEVNKKKGRKGHPSYPNQVEAVRKRMSGKNHYNWKGGVLSPRRQLVNRTEYKMFRKLMFERDDYTCQKCGKRGCEIHLHHKLPQHQREDLIMCESNVETLCVPCHVNQHPNINIMKGFVKNE